MKPIAFPHAAMLLCTAAVFIQQAPAQQPQARPCSNQTLFGAYGSNLSGTRPAPSVLPGLSGSPGDTEQVIGVVIQIFDGNGNFTQTDNVKGSLSGITPDRPGSGTYSINADCTGTLTVMPGSGSPAPTLVNRIVVLGDGDEIRGVVVSPQPVFVVSTGRRMRASPFVVFQEFFPQYRMLLQPLQNP